MSFDEVDVSVVIAERCVGETDLPVDALRVKPSSSGGDLVVGIEAPLAGRDYRPASVVPCVQRALGP